MVKWWDWFWGAVWIIGSALTAYLTARWFAINAAPADLGVLRYGLVAFSGLFGLLLGAFVLSVAIIGITSGSEWLLARWGYPLRPPPTESADTTTAGPITPTSTSTPVQAPDEVPIEVPSS